MDALDPLLRSVSDFCALQIGCTMGFNVAASIYGQITTVDQESKQETLGMDSPFLKQLNSTSNGE